MAPFWKKVKNRKNDGKIFKLLKNFDMCFKQPVTVNYGGDESYRTYPGALCSIFVSLVMIFWIVQGARRLLYGLDPDYAFLKKTNSRDVNDQLNLPEIYGQMYIGLRQTIEYTDGFKEYNFLDMDPEYINGKIDYYENGNLKARQNLLSCLDEDRDSYVKTVANSNGIRVSDYSMLRCIPPQQFNLFNEAGSPNSNSISLVFEQCGGRYSKEKDFEPVQEDGQDEEQTTDSNWQWTKANCDENILGDCDLPGLKFTEAQEEANELDKQNVRYEECQKQDAAQDQSCVQYWSEFPCDSKAYDSQCFLDILNKECQVDEYECQVGFLRAMCSQYADTIAACSTDLMVNALRLNNECLPGQRWCDGFHKILGGPSHLICQPFDLNCALEALFGQQIDTAEERQLDPLLSRMPKSSLSLQESRLINDFTFQLYSGIWQKGLSEDLLTVTQRQKFYKLGQQVLSIGGFYDFYQGSLQEITQKKQDQMDQSARLWLRNITDEGLDTPFMPLTSLKILEFKKVLNWLEDKYETDAFTKGVYYEELTEIELAKLYEIGTELFFKSKETFFAALYESKVIQPHQQRRIDQKVREYLAQNQRIAKNVFPLTSMSDQEFQDALRAIQLVLGNDFEALLAGKSGLPSSFEQNQILFSQQTPTILDALNNNFIDGGTLSQEQQDQIDADLKLYLTKNKLKLANDNYQLAEVIQMPLTELTAREYADVQLLFQSKFVPLYHQALNNDALFKTYNEQEMSEFLQDGEAIFGKEGINALYYRLKTITGNEQITIDGYIRTISQRSEQAKIVGLPNTTLTVFEYNKVLKIMRYKIGDAWQKKVDEDQNLSDQDEIKVEIAGSQITGYGNNFYEAFFRDINLSDEQQAEVDRQTRQFIQDNQQLSFSDVIEVAVIPGWPHTKLSQNQSLKIREIMTIKIGDVWNDLFFSEAISQGMELALRNLSTTQQLDCQAPNFEDSWIEQIQDSEDKRRVRRMGDELVGSEYFQQWNNRCDFTKDQQAIVDSSCVKFINSNEDLVQSQGQLLIELSQISGMPWSTLTQSEYDLIDKLAALMLPDDLWVNAFSQLDTYGLQEQFAVFKVGSRITGSTRKAQQYILGQDPSFTEWEQVEIDEVCFSFLKDYPDEAAAIQNFVDPGDPNLNNQQAEIYFLPKTTLSPEEWTQAQEIANFQTDGNFGRALVEKSLERISEEAQLKEVVQRMFGPQPGNEVYLIFWYRRADYQIVQFSKTVKYETAIRDYIAKYKIPLEQDKIALIEDPPVSIASMPLTTIHAGTLKRLNEVNSHRMGEQQLWTELWETQGQGNQTTRAKNAFKTIVKEMFGNNELAKIFYSDSTYQFTQSEQEIIDAGINAYVPCCLIKLDDYSVLFQSSRRLEGEHISSKDSYRKFRRVVDQKSGRKLQIQDRVIQSTTQKVDCMDENTIKEFLRDKSIVIYATESFVREPEEDDTEDIDEEDELVSYLVPIAEKRLDFRYHKEIGAKVEERQYLIEDQLVQMEQLNLEPREIIMSQMSIVSEDVVTREYWDDKKAEYVNTQESMLTINFELQNTLIEQTRTNYSLLQFFADIGGLSTFVISIIALFVSSIVGESFTHALLKSLYMQNTGEITKPKSKNGILDHPDASESVVAMNTIDPEKHFKEDQQNNNNDLSETQFLKDQKFLNQVQPYQVSTKQLILRNLRKINPRTCCKRGRQRRSAHQKIFDKGQKRTERALDVRSIIKSQEIMQEMLHTRVPTEEKRKLMRLQRHLRVLEPDTDPADSEDNLKDFKLFYGILKDNYQNIAVDYGQGDEEHQRLLRGVFEKIVVKQEKMKKQNGKYRKSTKKILKQRSRHIKKLGKGKSEIMPVIEAHFQSKPEIAQLGKSEQSKRTLKNLFSIEDYYEDYEEPLPQPAEPLRRQSSLQRETNQGQLVVDIYDEDLSHRAFSPRETQRDTQREFDVQSSTLQPYQEVQSVVHQERLATIESKRSRPGQDENQEEIKEKVLDVSEINTEVIHYDAAQQQQCFNQQYINDQMTKDEIKLPEIRKLPWQ